MTDPLAGYRPDWRRHLNLLTPGVNLEDDPLAGYNPDWRSQFSYAAPAPLDIQRVATPTGYLPDLLSETTALQPHQEDAFAAWLQRNQVHDLNDGQYDYRGAFLAGINRGPDGHWPDTFKQHAHPTFSTESQYSHGPQDGGTWQGEQFTPEGTSEPDPLADYHPNWRAEVARSVFGPLEPHQAPSPELLAGVRESAAAGVNETPFQNAYRDLARVGRQAAVSLPEQVVMGARDVAGTAGALGTALVDPSEALRGGQQVRNLFDPALEKLNELGGGEPQGFAETAARMVGPLPAFAAKGAFSRALASRASARAAEAEAMGTMARIHEAPATGLESPRARIETAQQFAERALQQGEAESQLASTNTAQADQAQQTIREALETTRQARMAPRFDEAAYQSAVNERAAPGFHQMNRTAEVLNEPANPIGDLITEFHAEQAPEPALADPTGAPSYLPNPFLDRRGISVGPVLPPLAGAVGGGAVGASQDPEHPIEGAALGALAGGAAGALLGPIASRLNRRGAVAVKPIPAGTSEEAIAGAIGEARGPRLVPPGGEINPDEYVNVAKFALDETGEQRLRSEVTRIVQEHGIHPKQVITWDETRRLAADIGLGDLPKEQVNTRLNGPQMLAIRNIVSTNIDALGGLYQKVKAGGLTPDEVKKVDRSIGYLERENDHLLARFTRNRTQTGRDLNNLKILANRVMDPFTWLTKAENLAEQAGKTLSPEQRAQIVELVTSGDKGELVKYVAGLRPVSRLDQAVTLWKTGLLTNPKTHLANILGNVAMAGLETAKDLPATLVDRVLSLGTKQQAKSLSLTGTAKATWRGAKAGAQEAWAIARHGVPADLTRWDLPSEVTFKNPILRAYTQLVRRGLAAPDAFFRKVALHRSLAEAERLGPLTEEAALQAIADSEYAVFQGGGKTPGVQSRFAQAGEGLRRPLGAVGHVIAPFTRTPGNVISATLDYSPFGAIRGARDIYRLIRAVKAQASPTELRALQKAASESIGRTVTGTSAAFLGGYILARSGKMTGARPMNSEQQDQWNLAGKQENAIRFGRHWLSLNRLSPIGNLMALGANYYYLSQNPEAGAVGAVLGALGSIGTTVTEQSFLRGVQDIKKAIDDPVGQAGQYAKNLAASVVPAAVGAIARGIDPVIRDTKGGFFDTFKSRLPGVSQKLPAQVDALGRVKKRTTGGKLAGTASQLFDPTTAREYRLDDPVISELERTGATLGELNMGRPRPAERRKLEALIRNTRSPTTKALLERRLQRAEHGEQRPDYLVRSKAEGQMLNQVLRTIVGDRNYKGLPLEAQREVLEAVIGKVRRDLGQLRRKAGR